jgi:hypothetical protein
MIQVASLQFYLFIQNKNVVLRSNSKTILKLKITINFKFLDARYWFGCVHVISVVLSFLSILTTSVMFNDLVRIY